MRLFSIVLVLALALSVAVVAEDRKDPRGPIPDFDQDLFASFATYRGSNWRGKDGDDLKGNMYPGTFDKRAPEEDSNCNGISGWSSSKGMSHEDYFCGKSAPMGVVMFGDSVGAGFTIPKEWIEWAGLTERYKNLLDPEWIHQQALREREKRDENDIIPVLLHEFDWPHKSWSTGFASDINGDSIYMKLRERNRCNHRDFQNLAVNGARAKHLIEQVGDLARTPADRPILAFVAYVGNDICKDSLDRMTKPEEFRAQIIAGLDALDQKVAPGSKVFLSGLVDGRILFDTMHNRKHPWLGITYAEVYDFLTFIDGNPCWTWLNRDASVRDKASERAAELSLVMKEIAETKQYKNFELAYGDVPMGEIIEEWKAKGGDVADLIAAVDGFHASLTAHREVAKKVWENLVRDYPSFVGQENPHNEEIIELFGEQGGH